MIGYDIHTLRYKRMKRICSTQGWTLLLYYLLMNVAVLLYVVVAGVIIAAAQSANGNYVDIQAIIMDLASSGMGYFIAIGLGMMIMLLWKKPKYLKTTICKNGRPMKFSDFIMIFVICLGIQGVFQIFAVLLETMLNRVGLSILRGIESATSTEETLSMFLYAAFGAPISEELLFRGFLLRSFEPMGKKFAIFTSALLFGLFHGNIIQIPFAFMVGLLWAYVTLEHSIWWAMLLHIFNNLILGDTIPRILPALPSNILFMVLFYGGMIAGIVLLICKHKSIANYWRSHKNAPMAFQAFFSNPGMLFFLVFNLIDIIYVTSVLITPYTFQM